MTGARGRTLSAMTAACSVRPDNGLSHENSTSCNVNSSQLWFNNFLESLYFFGKWGAKISNDFDLDYFSDQVKNVHPHIVIIDIGTNDLAAGVRPLSAAVNVVDFANDLLHRLIFLQSNMLRVCSATLQDRVDISKSEFFKGTPWDETFSMLSILTI